MRKVAALFLLLALPANASRETMNPLSGVLPTGRDERGWEYSFTDQGWEAKNTRNAANYASLRHFVIPESLVRENPRPYTWTVKVRAVGDERQERDGVLIGAGIVLDAGVTDKASVALMLRRNAEIRIGEIRFQEKQMQFPFTEKLGLKSGEEATFRVVESEAETTVFVNDRAIGKFKGVQTGRPAIVVIGAGVFHFRQFQMANKNGPVIWKLKSDGPTRR